MDQILTFRIGDEWYGIDVIFSREINRIPPILKIPRAPSPILGLVNLRGQIITVIDPAVLLQEGQNAVERDRLLIFKAEAEIHSARNALKQDLPSLGKDSLGMVVDVVGDVMDVEGRSVLPPPSNLRGTEREYVQGVILLEEDLLTILSVPAILKKMKSYKDEVSK